MGTYIKKSLFAIIYLFLMIITSISITFMIGEDKVLLKLILAIINFLCYAVVVVVISFRDGEDAMRTRYANDTTRKKIIETGDDLPLKLSLEYKWWKGFVHGLIVCFPMFLALTFHTLVFCMAGEEGMQIFGGIAQTLYSVVFIFFDIFEVGAKLFGENSFYIGYLTLFTVPVFLAMMGVPYIFGAKNAEKQYIKIREKEEMIYGDKN